MALVGSPGSWITALDFDFTAQGSQTFGTDGLFTFGGMQWTKIHSAGDSVSMANVAGTGLVVQPVAATDWSGSSYTAPLLQLPFMQIPQLSTIDWSSGLRVWAYISADNCAANFDNAIVSVQLLAPLPNTLQPAYGNCAKRGFGTTGVGFQTIQELNSGAPNGFVSGNVLTLGATNRVLVLELPEIMTSQMKLGFGQFGNGASSWPDPNNIGSYSWGQQGAQALNTFLASSQLLQYPAQQLGIAFGAQRSGSGTALSVTFARMRIDYRK